MQTFLHYLQDFYQTHHAQLEEHYPGLHLSRLEDELKIICLHEGIEAGQMREVAFLESSESKVSHFFRGLLKGLPLPHLSHSTYFFHDTYYVNSQVLVPRFETEILVDEASKWALAFLDKNPTLRLADVATGSGCVLGALNSLLPSARCQAWAIDYSPEALKVAKINFFRQRLGERLSSLTVIQGDRLAPLLEKNVSLDLIVSNPPYLQRSCTHNIHPQVLAHEPGIALFVEGDYEQWYREFFAQCEKVLVPGGALFMEGDEEALPQLQKLCLNFAFESQLIKDLTGRWRVLCAHRI